MYEKMRFPQNAEAAWAATKLLLVEDGSYFGDILSRFAMSSRAKPLTLFVPWGVRPAGEFGSKEKEALDAVQKYQQLLGRNGVYSNVLVMPADVYATEVNNYEANEASRYFSTVTRAALRKGFEVTPWSQIRQANKRMYDRIIQREASLESLWRSTPKSLWGDLLNAATRRSKQDKDEVAKAAFDYLKERVAEARIIDDVYKPIKISMVSPKKDNVVDRDLPRLYILPRNLRFPWMPDMGGVYER